MIPQDPVMLLSFVNTQLRDKCSSLEEFCYEYNADKTEIITKLETINYSYSSDVNQFI